MNQGVIDLFPKNENRETEVSGFRFFASKAILSRQHSS